MDPSYLLVAYQWITHYVERVQDNSCNGPDPRHQLGTPECVWLEGCRGSSSWWSSEVGCGPQSHSQDNCKMKLSS